MFLPETQPSINFFSKQVLLKEGCKDTASLKSHFPEMFLPETQPSINFFSKQVLLKE